MPQMLMITQKYIRLYFLARFNGIFGSKINYFKKYKIGLSQIASTNLFSFNQNKKKFMGLK